MALLRGLIRLIVLPVKLALALVGLAFRLGLWIGRVPVRLTAGVGRATGKLLGAKGLVGIVLGAVVVAFLTPFAGRELRERVRKLLAAPGIDDGELQARVSFELAHAPRTWHLTQPAVSVNQGRVRLAGEVSDDEARTELVRVAAAIPGVSGVDDALVSASTGGGASGAASGEDAPAASGS